MGILLQNDFSILALKKALVCTHRVSECASLRFFDAGQNQERVLEAPNAFSQRIVKGFSAGQKAFLLTVLLTFPASFLMPLVYAEHLGLLPFNKFLGL